MGRGADHTCPTFTDIILFVRKVASKDNTSLLAPFLAKAAKHSWKLSLLKALA